MGNKIYTIDPLLIEIHRLANEHRDMSSSEFESLKKDIEINGQLIPVILYRGKLVDGRHRLKALKELHIDKIKVMKLPNNLSIDDVRAKVLGSENRRTDTPAQKAIRAYNWFKSYDNRTQQEAAIKFAVPREDVSYAKKIENGLGYEKLMFMYNNGYMMLNGRRYKSLKTIVKLLMSKDKTDNKIEPMNDHVRKVFDILYELKSNDDIVSLAQVNSLTKRLIAKELE